MTRRRIAWSVMALALAPAGAQAATVWRPDPDKPILIMAAKLSVSETRRVAIFSGDVRLTQGDTRLQCSLLRAHYIPGRRADQGRIDRVECEP